MFTVSWCQSSGSKLAFFLDLQGTTLCLSFANGSAHLTLGAPCLLLLDVLRGLSLLEGPLCSVSFWKSQAVCPEAIQDLMAGVANSAPWELPSCRLQFQPCSNTPAYYCQVILITLIKWFRCVWLWLELNLERYSSRQGLATLALRCWHHSSALPWCEVSYKVKHFRFSSP